MVFGASVTDIRSRLKNRKVGQALKDVYAEFIINLNVQDKVVAITGCCRKERGD